VNDAN